MNIVSISRRYQDKLHKKKLRDIVGPQLKKIKVKPFKKRISPELIAKIEENTKINNQHIKFYSTIDTRDDKFLVKNILRKSKAVK